MASNTFTKIATVTVGSGGASSIDFSSIPATYTDLCIKFSLASTSANQNTDGLAIKVNNSTANLSRRTLYGDGSGAASTNNTNGYIGFTSGNSATNTFGNGEIYIPNYASSNYKSMSADNVSEANQTTAYAFLTAVLWSSTSAINQLTLYYTGGDTFKQYSAATLYGIRSS